MVQGNMKLLDYINTRTGEDAGFTIHVRDGEYLLRTWGNAIEKETKHSTHREAQVLGMQWLLFCMTKGVAMSATPNKVAINTDDIEIPGGAAGGVVALHRKRRAAAAVTEASFIIRDEPAADALDRSELAERLAAHITLDK